MALWFAVTPHVLQSLGPERFGVWSLLFLLSGYLATLDLGLGSAVVKFTADHATTKDWGSLRSTLGEITRTYLFVGALWVLVVAILHPWILHRLHVSSPYFEEVRFALLASALVFAAANLINIGPGILNGLQKMDLANGLLVASSIPQVLILIIGLDRGYGLYAVVLSTAIQWLSVALGSWILLRRLVPHLAWPSIRLDRPAGNWMRFSFLMQANNILVLSQQQIDKLILAFLVSLPAVTSFELGFRVANGIQSLPVLPLATLLPVFAELWASRDQDAFRRLWERGTELLAAGALGLGACAIPAAPLLVRAWIGADHPLAERLAQWLLAGFAINLTTGVATAAARGAGRPELEVPPALLGLAVHVLASVVLLRIFGPVGVGPALCLGMIVSTVFCLSRFAAWVGVPRSLVFRIALAKPVASSIAAAGVTAWVVSLFPPSWGQGRWSLLAWSTLAGGSGAIMFLTGWWAMSRLGGGRISPRDLRPIRVQKG